MRLWHKDLLPYLPDKQLLSQWRECCAIARNIKVNGTPNHLLVNKIMNYPDEHFDLYVWEVQCEFIRRGYKINFSLFTKWRTSPAFRIEIAHEDLFDGWHNECYARQCMANLSEKWDCGGISNDEWSTLAIGYGEMFGEPYSV